MAEARSIHQFPSEQNVTANTLLLIDKPNQSASSGYDTEQSALSVVGKAIVDLLEYTQDLDTIDKTIIGAINELFAQVGGYTEVVGTLTAGQTSITLSDVSILTTSTLDFYTDIFGVSPTSVTVATGSVTLTFEAQSEDMSVKVRVS